MKIFNSGELIDDCLVMLDGESYAAIVGKHCIWIPEKNMKIIWSYNGKIESYRQWELGRNNKEIKEGTFNQEEKFYDLKSLKSITDEYNIMKELGELNMAPPVSGIFYIKSFTSNFPYEEKHCDPKGKYGYFIANANKLLKGSYTLDQFKAAMVFHKVKLSQGALGDLNKESNIINGYLVDVRRTLWDMMIYIGQGKVTIKDIFYIDSKKKIKDKIQRLSQFPHNQRKYNYQTYLMVGDGYQEGSRDTLYRFKKMKMIELHISGKSVVDLGCNLGAMCVEAYRRGARKITGVDHEQDYIDCAVDLARYNGMNINYLQIDLNDVNKSISFFKKYYRDGVDIVFALSLYKHIGKTLWNILNGFKWKTCFIESNNASEGLETGHVIEMMLGMKKLKGEITYLGQTTDRSPRCLWKITK